MKPKTMRKNVAVLDAEFGSGWMDDVEPGVALPEGTRLEYVHTEHTLRKFVGKGPEGRLDWMVLHEHELPPPSVEHEMREMHARWRK
jgi:hypothetical protein